ncbi:MAG: sortase [Chloroflexi bacterium]|nr:sortase [Chloroflexota bacterium]
MGITSRVADIYSGASGSNPVFLTVYNGKLYFGANGNDGAGRELWSYDGTNVSRAADINPGSTQSNPMYFAVYNGKLYFSANGGDGAGDELWSFDGTTASRVADINPGMSSSSPSHLAVYNNKLYFGAFDGSFNYGNELYVYDGSNVSLALNINTGYASSTPTYLTVFDGKLFFQANGGDNTGSELWSYNGTTASRAADIYTGNSGSNPAYLTALDGKLYFAANAGDGKGNELWSFNGTTASLAVDIYSGATSSSPSFLTTHNGILYFSANGGDGSGVEIWSYDGTTASRSADIWSGVNSSTPSYLSSWNNKIYLSANGNDGAGTELWSFVEDNTPPQITASTPANGATISPTNTIILTFSEDVVHDGTDKAANYTGNFVLVEAKGNGFQTTACNATDFVNDKQISIESATYNNNSGSGPFQTTLVINNSLPLPIGNYRLFTCGTTSIYDFGGNRMNGGADSVINFSVMEASQVDELPQTGFAFGKVTLLPKQSASKSYIQTNNISLIIPTLNIDIPIVGVPLLSDGWDVTWLGTKAGWLQGSAFPTWNGNSVLTGHNYNANGNPGIFSNLGDLRWGDKVIVGLGDLSYIYEVRQVMLNVDPSDVETLMTHKETPWLTMVTCRGYDEDTDTFRWRTLVRAVLLKVE